MKSSLFIGVQYRAEERGIVLYRPEDRRLIPGQQQVGEDPQRVPDQHQLLLLPAGHRRDDSRKLAEPQVGFQHRSPLPPPDFGLLERLPVQHCPERPRRAPRLRMVTPGTKTRGQRIFSGAYQFLSNKFQLTESDTVVCSDFILVHSLIL